VLVTAEKNGKGENAMTDTVKPATLAETAKFFGYKNLAKFRADWSQLTDKDKTDLRTGIGNGTFDY
jgi:hypothetical protein